MKTMINIGTTVLNLYQINIPINELIKKEETKIKKEPDEHRSAV